MPSNRPSLSPYQDDNSLWRCGARNRSGKPCAHFAPDEPHRCYLHGANTPQVKAKQERTRQTEAAATILATYGLPRTIDPAAALLEEIARTAGHIDWLGTIIKDIDPEALGWGVTKIEQIKASEFRGKNTTEAAGISVWLDLYHRERTMLVKTCTAALSAGIAERQVRLAEQQGSLIADVLRAVFADPTLGLTSEQRKAAVGVVRHHLQLVRGA